MDDKTRENLIRTVQLAAAKEYDIFIARVRAEYDSEIKRLKEEVIGGKDNEIALLKADIAQLKAMSELRSNLYAFSDTFHIAAKRIAETEDPVEEANTLNIMADQLLTVMGLPTRPKEEFA
jgi:hypothetical protein